MAADQDKGNGFAIIVLVFLLSAGAGGRESVCLCSWVPVPGPR